MANPIPIDEDEAVELQIDRVETTLKRLLKSIDEDVQSGQDARALHDFVQDELLPVMSMLASDVKAIASIVSAHDEMIADLQDEESDGTRISAEHAEELIEHLTECNSILTQLYEQSRAAGSPLTPLLQRVEKGKALIEFVKSAVMGAEEDEESEPN